MDQNYTFKIDVNVDLAEQNISKEANAILISLFRQYYANDRQKQILDSLLYQNLLKAEKI